MTDQNTNTIRPEFVRAPRPGGRCQLTGLSRATIYSLIASGDIKTISLRKRNKARGVRLIVADSLIQYINSHAGVSS